MRHEIIQALEQNPIIAAVKDMEQLQASLKSPVRIVILLFGDICTLEKLINAVKAAGKLVIVHADFIIGFSQKEVVADYIQQRTQADGIISTRPNLIQRSKSIGLFSILRIFLIDSMALDSLNRRQVIKVADAIELLPGVIPYVIRSTWESTHLPLITGGLIRNKLDIVNALSAGAIGVSTSNAELWNA